MTELTTLNTGLGNDVVTVSLNALQGGFFVLDTQGAYENTLALPQTYFAGSYDTPTADVVTVALNGNLLAPSQYTVIPSLNVVATTISPVAHDIVTVRHTQTKTQQFVYTGNTLQLAAGTFASGDGLQVLVNGTAVGAHIGTDLRTIVFDATPTANALVLVRVTHTVSVDTPFASIVPPADGDYVDGSGSSLPLVVFGGAGADTLIGGSGNDILVGDRGRIAFVDNPAAITLDNGVVTTPASAGVEAVRGNGGPGDLSAGPVPASFLVQTWRQGVDGTDHLVGNGGADILLGGLGDDFLYGDAAVGYPSAGTPGNDVLLGDDGAVLAPGGAPSIATSTDPTLGGHDTLDGAEGSDVAIGGGNSDTITASLGGDIVLGDSGYVDLLGDVYSIAPDSGGDDSITGGTGLGLGNRSILIGGAGNDTLQGGNGDNIILGDNGYVHRVAGVALQVYSIDTTVGGVDHITSGSGDDLIIGGAAGDYILGTSGNDVILGDNGVINLNNAGSNDVYSLDLSSGGDDWITTGASGIAIVIGGAGTDNITAGTGDAVIIGDNGEVDRGPAPDETIIDAFTTDTTAATGARDIIISGAGNNVIIGGNGNDDITASSGSQNIILGDNGVVNLNNAGTNDIYSTDLADRRRRQDHRRLEQHHPGRVRHRHDHAGRRHRDRARRQRPRLSQGRQHRLRDAEPTSSRFSRATQPLPPARAT